ncbi:MAG: D-Ala-D-Ala carboxypeptidase family metallohydrolase [Pseudomonadota bacterium]
MQIYASWRDYPTADWRWPDFQPEEMACRGTGALAINETAMDRLQALRDEIGKPFIIQSAFRSEEHNRAVGGAKNSQHLLAKAFDISMKGHAPHAFERAAKRHGFRGIGIYPRSGFMHIDTRDRAARWKQGGQSGPEFPPDPPQGAQKPALGGEVYPPAVNQPEKPKAPVAPIAVPAVAGVAAVVGASWSGSWVWVAVGALVLAICGAVLWRVMRKRKE